jgi:hypothetical protein
MYEVDELDVKRECMVTKCFLEYLPTGDGNDDGEDRNDRAVYMSGLGVSSVLVGQLRIEKRFMLGLRYYSSSY